MQFVEPKSVGGLLVGSLLLLGVGGDTALVPDHSRMPDCPDPGIFLKPDSSVTGQLRIIDPPERVDPDMVRPSGTDCRAIRPDPAEERGSGE